MKKNLLFAAGFFIYSVCFVGKLQLPSLADAKDNLTEKPEVKIIQNCYPGKDLKYELFPYTEDKPSSLFIEPK